MTGSPIILAIAAGLAAAVLFATANLMGTAGGLLLLISPLPIALAGLLLGGRTPLYALFAGTGALAVAGQIGAAITFLLAGAGGATILTLLLLRERATSRGDTVTRAWYPFGRALAWLAFWTVLLFLLVAFAAGLAGGEGLWDGWRRAVAEAVNQPGSPMAPAVAPLVQQYGAGIVDVLALAVPPVTAALFVLMQAVNVMAAQGILAAAGQALRPALGFPDFELPLAVPLAFAGAVALSSLGGETAFQGLIIAGILSAPLFLLGLSLIHGISHALPGRAIALALFYLLLAFLPWLAAIPVAAGLVESVAGFRRRLALRLPPPEE